MGQCTAHDLTVFGYIRLSLAFYHEVGSPDILFEFAYNCLSICSKFAYCEKSKIKFKSMYG